eukprot:6187693-Pleurochrysis_carterae.AAC.1
MRWLLEKCASLADTTDTRELLISTETQTHLHIAWQWLPKSPRAANAFADAAWEGVVGQDPPRPRIGKG